MTPEDAAAAELESVLRTWDGLGVVSRFDAATGAWFFVALHDATLGRPSGGTRMKRYPSPAAALRDAQRLAEGMTAKWAVAGIPYGGGKAVIALAAPLPAEERRGLLRRYGRFVESLGGLFATGEDLGTTPDDMADIAAATRYVLGGHGGGGRLVDPGPFTAHGVAAAMSAALAHVDGDGSLADRRVAVQGVGDVGLPLARRLRAGGAALAIADVDGERAAAVAAELGAERVDAEAIYDVECDVFAPCAVGATVNHDTIPRLACRVVCGSANNQLADDADAERLHRRGILYAPDYVANAGGAIAFAHLAEAPEATREELFARVGALRGVLDEVFSEAAEHEESPLRAAARRVERTLAAGPAPADREPAA